MARATASPSPTPRALVALAQALDSLSGERPRVREHGRGRLWYDSGEREPEAWYVFNTEGDVWQGTCSYSGHNGDSYDRKERQLGKAEALQALHAVVNEVERRALDAEVRLIEDEEHRRRQQAARSSLDNRLKSKGVLPR